MADRAKTVLVIVAHADQSVILSPRLWRGRRISDDERRLGGWVPRFFVVLHGKDSSE